MPLRLYSVELLIRIVFSFYLFFLRQFYSGNVPGTCRSHSSWFGGINDHLRNVSDYKSGSDSENGSQRDRDPGCLSIPLTIGNTHFPKALIDSGAGLNLMALCTARRIGLGEPGNSTRQIIFGDNSVGAVKGVYLDIWVKIGEICLLTDFHVLDICEDPKTPIK